MHFPLDLTPDDNGTILVTCPQLPEVITFGETSVEALHHGREAVEEALGARIARWQPFDMPDAATLRPAVADGRAVRLSLLADAKATLFVACRDAGITRAELARRMNAHREQVDRLFRFDHASRVDQIEAAFNAIGRPVQIALDTEAA